MPKSTSHKKEDEFDDEETEVKTKGSKKSKTKKVKGPSSAYNIYVAEHRAAISAENPGLSFGELSKRVSADWKQLSEDQRKPYEERAAEDKKRYEREAAENPESDNDEPAKKKKKKDPDAPKKNLNAWMFFIQQVRPQVVAELGEDGKRVAAVTKAVGERWSKMSAEEKAPYEQMAEEDKKRYAAEMEVYNASH